MTQAVAEQLAAVYSDHVVFPHEIVVDDGGAGLFPGWGHPVLVLSHENQGVCSWGVSLGGDDLGAVLVGGEVQGEDRTVVYAESIEAFIAGRRWDGRCLNQEPLLQAQAGPLQARELNRLREMFDESSKLLGGLVRLTTGSRVAPVSG